MTLSDLFERSSEIIPCEISIERILAALPRILADQTVELRENLAEIRYTFAEPFRTDGRFFAIGTPQLPEAIYLYLAIIVALRHMSDPNQKEFLSKIAIPGKHLDALSEIRPILSASEPNTIEYEVPGIGNKKIDWKFQFGENSILIDVKNRSGNTYQHLVDIVLHQKAGNAGAPMPRTDGFSFFKSTADKFPRTRDKNTRHGAWIISGIRESEAELTRYFNDTDISQSLARSSHHVKEGVRTI